MSNFSINKPIQKYNYQRYVSFKGNEPTEDKKQNNEKAQEVPNLQDKALSSSPLSKLKTTALTTAKLPEYAYRGLKGDQNANFYEFLQLGNIPYLVGGGVLYKCFDWGGKGAAKNANLKLAGVLLYYGMIKASQMAIDTPVKMFRGIDLNQPYRHMSDLKVIDKKGTSPKRTEYHKLYESVDFTRWDLLYDRNGKKVNSKYDKLAHKMNANEEMNDSDSSLKPRIRSLIIQAKAYKTLLIAPFVTIAIGMASQKPWENLTTSSIKEGYQKAFSNKGILNKAKYAGLTTYQHFVKPIPDSFKAYWGSNKTAQGVILGTAALVGIANLHILSKSSLKKEKIAPPPDKQPETAQTKEVKKENVKEGGNK